MFEKLIALLVDQIKIPAENIGPKATPDQIDLNSLTIVELSVALEEELGITITEQELKETATLGDIAKLMEDRAAQS